MRAYQKKTAVDRTLFGFNSAVQLKLDAEELIRLFQENVHSVGAEIGRIVAAKLLEDEVQQLCGDHHERSEARQGSRHGHQRGTITIAGQKIRMEKPRVRHNGREHALRRYEVMQREDAMPEAVLARMIRGVSCRDYAGVIDLAHDGFGVRKSSVSRSFVDASRVEVQQLIERRFDGVRFPVIMIDGVDYAGTTMIVVLGIQNDGQKRILGFREGATENAEVCRMLLEELCERGLCRDEPTLFVLDGSKALRKAVIAIWGRFAIVQRCQLHKKRNVQAHVPARHWDEVRRQINDAYQQSDPNKALKRLKTTAAYLDRISPDAADSLREGMEETITVIRLGLPDELRRHVASSNIIESSLATTQKVSRNVKRWRDGTMRRRWCATGLLVAEKKFRRVKGHRHMPKLIAALDRIVNESASLSKIA